MSRLSSCAVSVFSLFCFACAHSLPAAAQITVGSLDPAAQFDAGVLQSGQGGLDPSLWQGSDAKTVTSLINGISKHPSQSARIFLRAAVLSGGTPPQSTSSEDLAAFQRARLDRALHMTSLQNYDFIAGRTSSTPGSAASLVQSADRALIGGDMQAACQTSGMVSEGRGEPYWVKLRSFCHYLADELPATELTADLLKKNGHEDAGFYALIGTLSETNIKPVDFKSITSPLHIAMASKAIQEDKLKGQNFSARLMAGLANAAGEDPAQRLDILLGAADLLEPMQIQALLIEMSDTPLSDISSLPKTGTWAARDWGRVFLALRETQDMDAQSTLMTALLAEADSKGVLMPIANVFAGEISSIPYSFQVATSADIFTKIVVNNRDLAALRDLHSQLDTDDPLRARIALTSDALGNGFMLSELGLDIETGLSAKGDEKVRAVRDTYIAVGMGAHLSETALRTLSDVKTLPGLSVSSADMLAIRSAAKRGSKGEVALRIAKVFGDKEITTFRADAISNIFFALTDAGMTDLAGRLAAQDFMAKM